MIIRCLIGITFYSGRTDDRGFQGRDDLTIGSKSYSLSVTRRNVCPGFKVMVKRRKRMLRRNALGATLVLGVRSRELF